MVFEYHIEIFRKFGGLILKPFGLHPQYPFIHPFQYGLIEFHDELKWLLWYLTHLYHIGINFIILDLGYFLDKAIQGDIPPEIQNFSQYYNSSLSSNGRKLLTGKLKEIHKQQPW